MRSPTRARRGSGVAPPMSAQPGIDPRVWFSLAVVKELGWDPVAIPGVSGGVFADVQLLPDGEPETCFIGMPYAEDGAGAWFPLEIGELVVVAVPMGDTGSGPTIVARMWRKSAAPVAADLDWAPGAGAQEPPSDIWIRAKQGKAIKIRTQAADIDIRVEVTGDVVIENLGTGKVKLGLAETAQPVTNDTLLTLAIQAASTVLAGAPGVTDNVLRTAVVAALNAIAAAPTGTVKTEAT